MALERPVLRFERGCIWPLVTDLYPQIIIFVAWALADLYASIAP
jgi:hypothetical protein